MPVSMPGTPVAASGCVQDDVSTPPTLRKGDLMGVRCALDVATDKIAMTRGQDLLDAIDEWLEALDNFGKPCAAWTAEDKGAKAVVAATATVGDDQVTAPLPTLCRDPVVTRASSKMVETVQTELRVKEYWNSTYGKMEAVLIAPEVDVRCGGTCKVYRCPACGKDRHSMCEDCGWYSPHARCQLPYNACRVSVVSPCSSLLKPALVGSTTHKYGDDDGRSTPSIDDVGDVSVSTDAESVSLSQGDNADGEGGTSRCSMAHLHEPTFSTEALPYPESIFHPPDGPKYVPLPKFDIDRRDCPPQSRSRYHPSTGAPVDMSSPPPIDSNPCAGFGGKGGDDTVTMDDGRYCYDNGGQPVDEANGGDDTVTMDDGLYGYDNSGQPVDEADQADGYSVDGGMITMDSASDGYGYRDHLGDDDLLRLHVDTDVDSESEFRGYLDYKTGHSDIFDADDPCGWGISDRVYTKTPESSYSWSASSDCVDSSLFPGPLEFASVQDNRSQGDETVQDDRSQDNVSAQDGPGPESESVGELDAGSQVDLPTEDDRSVWSDRLRGSSVDYSGMCER